MNPLSMQCFPEINIRNYNYSLPVEKIAQYPLKQRDESRLVVFKDSQISESKFSNISSLLPKDSLMIINETRVIQARIPFQKESGAAVEIFCLEPVSPTKEIQQAFEQTSGVIWKCLVGNSKKWKSGVLAKSLNINGTEVILNASRIDKKADHSLIEFSWYPKLYTFSEILEKSGIIPLPPYMNRSVIPDDTLRYQTVFAKSEGSVAAPTAALHFTKSLMRKVEDRNIKLAKVTLHVGAGTFKPVSSDNVRNHEMHTEKIRISYSTIKAIYDHLEKPIAVVGTTTMRTVESLYWHGVKCMIDKAFTNEIDVLQFDPYQSKYNIGIPVKDVLTFILKSINMEGKDVLHGQTQLMIVPGYLFKIPQILITNFHMPKSTLLLLVSAFIGDDWKKVYDYALENDFRFLSYGDSCLFHKQ